MTDRDTGKSRGFGFVTYAHSTMVDEAMSNRYLSDLIKIIVRFMNSCWIFIHFFFAFIHLSGCSWTRRRDSGDKGE